MPHKRDVLELLSRDELLAVVDRFELVTTDRRAKDALIEIVAASKKATLPDILPELSRDRLKDLCRRLELDDGGREKDALVERLLGGKPAETAAPSRKNGAPRNGAQAKAEPLDVVPGEKLTVERLERYLWSAADILRGSIRFGGW